MNKKAQRTKDMNPRVLLNKRTEKESGTESGGNFSES